MLAKRLHWNTIVKRGLSGDYKIDCPICGGEGMFHIDRLKYPLAKCSNTWFRIRCHCGEIASYLIARHRLRDSDKRLAISRLRFYISEFRSKAFVKRLRGDFC